jgi:hypothetical protein
VSVVFATVDADRSAADRRALGPELAFASLHALIADGIAVEVVFPVHPATVDELPAVVRTVADRFGNAVQMTLRRSPSAQQNPHAARAGAVDWPELDRLSNAIAALPDVLPGGAWLQFDPVLGYAACMLQAPARRQDLFGAGGRRAGAHPLGSVCQSCAWSAHCTFRADRGAADGRVHPLTTAQAGALEPPARRWVPSRTHFTPTAPVSACPICSVWRRGRR